VTVDGGNLLSQYGYIGYGSTATGVVTVSGTSSTWANSHSLYVGYNGSGTLSIANGGGVSSNDGIIGDNSGSKGLVAVDGAGSTWTNSGLNVGYYGAGTLSITNGGSVSVAGSTFVGAPGFMGTIAFGTRGGTLTTQSLFASPSHLTGTGTINTSGLVGDIDLKFDSTHALSQVIPLQRSGQNVTINLDLTGSPNGNGALGAGFNSAGSLTIQDGIKVNSTDAFIGYNSGSTGTATVTGTGSTWTNNGLYVGNFGSGTLSITNGGTVSTAWFGYVGYNPGSRGLVAVDGAGSAWNNGDSLDVGYSGSGTLSIAGGGGVTATSISVHNGSLLAIDVGRGSLLTVGDGAITNAGAVRILAGAGVLANTTTYSPISAGTWSGAGAYQAIGGTWSTTSHTFTASSVTPGASGSAVALDLASVQRALVSDNGTGWVVGASFPAAGTTTNITFTAAAMSDATFGGLRSQLGANEAILGGWSLSTTNYTVNSNNPVYLSFDIGPGYPADDLDVWQYVGTTWSKYTPTDLTYDGTYASFTATGLSGFAMSGVPMPEPGTLALLAAGLLGLLVYARQTRKQP
jgi:T5SS/PEP-CTERM-associated repeat protein